MKKKMELSKNPVCTFMNKKASALVELLVLLVVAVLSSAVVLLLVRGGVLEVKSTPAEYEEVLNTEFLPYAQEGTLVIKGFQFCSFVDLTYQCITEKEHFTLGEQVHFRFVVESSVFAGEVVLIQNYRVRGPAGNIILNVDERRNAIAQQRSSQQRELVPFKDFLVSDTQDALGRYTFELVVENPLINKKITLSREFTLVEP